MTDVFAKTAEFARTILGLNAPSKPTRLNNERKTWALRAFREEVQEFEDSITLEEEVDAVEDLIYFAAGRLHEMGVDGARVFDVVHEANMKKKRGRLAKRSHGLIEGFDAIKPPGWISPDIEAAIYGLDPEAMAKQALAKAEEAAQIITRARKRSKLKFLVIGYGRHGKDTVCDMMAQRYGLKFQSSSMFCAEKVLFPYFTNRAYLPNYTSAEACYNDRHNMTVVPDGHGGPHEVPHRIIWYNQIRAFNRPDATSLATAMLEEYNIYCGMRAADELNACKNKKLFDHIIWVDASERHPVEDKTSCTVEPWMADYIISNNGDLEELHFNMTMLVDRLVKEAEDGDDCDVL